MKIVQKYILSFLLITSTVQICAMDNEHQTSNMQSIVAQQGREQQKPTETEEQKQARWERNKKVTSLLAYGSWCADNILEMLVGSIGYARPSLVFSLPDRKIVPWIVAKQRCNIVQAVKKNNYDFLKESCELLDAYTSLFISPKALKSSDFIKNYKEPKSSDILNDFNRGRTLLHMTNDNKIAQLLLDCGVNIDVLNVRGCTVLHEAVINWDDEMMKLFLDRGANPDARRYKGFTPLHEAVYWGNIKAVELLLDHGADIEAEPKDGYKIEDLSRSFEMDKLIVQARIARAAQKIVSENSK